MYNINWLASIKNHLDIEECFIGTHNCSHHCVELDGGYNCNCANGYELKDDKVTCEGVV